MDLIDRFMPYQLPRQYIYISELYQRLFTPGRGRGETAFAHYDAESQPPAGIGAANVGELKARLFPGPVGLVLAPHFFIYNLFSFDRIPLKPGTQRELVEWKLEKIFPDKLDNYLHRFYKVDGRTILSVLVRSEWLAQLESAFGQDGIAVTYVGNSSIEIINRLFRRRQPPDFLVEYDRASVLLAFQSRKKLLYMRKFRAQSTSDILEEIEKTLHFVRGQFKISPKTFALVSPGLPPQESDLAVELRQLDLLPAAFPADRFCFLPVAP